MPTLDYEAAKQYGPLLAFPVYYGRPLYDIWIKDTSQFALATLATLAILALLRNFVFFLWGFIKPSKLQSYCHAETGSWALVTGASDGIGRGFVDEFLDRGFNVLLHSRSEKKLQGIQKELQQKYPRRSIEIVAADASSSNNPENAVVEKVNSLPGKLVVLVNNVGGTVQPTPSPGYSLFSDVSQAAVDAQINLNARFPTQLTRALLPRLLENKPALILNCCSVTSVFGVPYLTTYAATKGHNLAFTKSLQNEIISEGLAGDVEVMGFVIANVISASNTQDMWPFTITARQCARGCLARVGSGKTVAYASWRHAVQITLFTAMPERWLRALMLPDIRKRKDEAVKAQ